MSGCTRSRSGVLEGIPGAVIAVPFLAVVYAVVRFLATGEDQAAEDVPPDEDPHKPLADIDLVPETG
jgi:hypothetical protein